MGMAKLDIWISRMDDPCGVDDRTWYVTIYDCDGNVLRWCGKSYAVLPAPCGHLKLKIPPGCYYLKAVWNFSIAIPGLKYYANHFTDAAIVQACCGKTVCVKLFNPSAHRCGIIIVEAVRDLLRQKVIKAETAQKVVKAMEELIPQIPAPHKKFEIGHLEEIAKLLKERGHQSKKK